MKVKNVIFCIVFASFTGITIHISGQARQQWTPFSVNDSLSLPQILKQVLVSYPTIDKAQEAIQAAEAGVGLAKSGYYPNITANAGYTRIDPVPELTIPILGHFIMAPNNNYNASVGVYENVYDFEKTRSKADPADFNKLLYPDLSAGSHQDQREPDLDLTKTH